jgi:RimJ/RimL family protein N-acetyltransferase
MSQLTVSRATQADSADLFAWRNDPQTRAVSLNTDEVAWPDHERWFAASLANPRRVIYLARDGAQSIGMIRFDIDERGERAEVSINLNPDARGKGYGTRTLMAGLEQFAVDRPDLRGTTAQIRSTNAPSIAIFTKAGYALTDTIDGVGQYVLDR